MIDFSKIDLDTIEPTKTDVLYKSVEVTTKGTCMYGELDYYATGVHYTTASGNQLWDKIFVRMHHKNMAMSWEFEIRRDYSNRIPADKMELYAFAAGLLDKILTNHKEEQVN